MVAPDPQLSEHPNLEEYIKDGKLTLPYSFPFRNQPAKVLYVIYWVALLLFMLPLWIIRNALPSWRPSRSWTIGQAVGVRTDSPYIHSPHLWN
jgi:hypothetical protein